MKGEEEMTRKEKRVFWLGALVGIVGGFVGNMLEGYLFNFTDALNPKNLWYIDLTGVVVFTALFFAILFFINKQVLSNKK